MHRLLCPRNLVGVALIGLVALIILGFVANQQRSKQLSASEDLGTSPITKPPPLSSEASRAREEGRDQDTQLQRSFDKYILRIAERSACPKFTAAEVEQFLSRRGREPRTLSFAALLLNDRNLLEEARSLNPDDPYVVHAETKFAINDIRNGNPEALGKIAELLAQHPESQSLQLGFLYATRLNEHFVTSKLNQGDDKRILTSKQLLQMLPRSENVNNESVSFRDLLYDSLKHEKGINEEDDLILKTSSEPFSLSPLAGGHYVMKELLLASKEESDSSKLSELGEFAARQLALIANERDSTNDIIARHALMERELTFLNEVDTTKLNLESYLNITIEQYRSELAEDMRKSDLLTTKFFDIIFEKQAEHYQDINPVFNSIDAIISNLEGTTSENQ